MSEDLTKNVLDTNTEAINLILTIVKRIESHETILTQIMARLEKHGTILIQILGRIDALETRVGVVESRLDAIDVRLRSLEQTMKRSVHSLERGQTVLNDAILKINVGFLDVNERLQGLEPQQKRSNSST